MTSQPDSTPSKAIPPSNRRALWAVLAAAVLLIGAVVVWSVINGRLPFGAPTFHGTVIQSPDVVGDFTLTASTGEQISLSDLRGQVVLMYFGYTFCPDACPTTLNELKKVPPALGDRADEVQVVMVTVDPQRDTPEVLREYLSYFDPSFLGLTGTEEEVLAAATPLGIYFSAHEGSAATGYLVDHTTSVLAIDKDGYLRLLYSFETPGEDIAADMRHLVRQ
ncbi:MAG: SCO family protein [Candidatus Promineofilum sp.]|nr:SCO family protein [Promineifilum sp.]